MAMQGSEGTHSPATQGRGGLYRTSSASGMIHDTSQIVAALIHLVKAFLHAVEPPVDHLISALISTMDSLILANSGSKAPLIASSNSSFIFSDSRLRGQPWRSGPRWVEKSFRDSWLSFHRVNGDLEQSPPLTRLRLNASTGHVGVACPHAFSRPASNRLAGPNLIMQINTSPSLKKRQLTHNRIPHATCREILFIRIINTQKGHMDVNG